MVESARFPDCLKAELQTRRHGDGLSQRERVQSMTGIRDETMGMGKMREQTYFSQFMAVYGVIPGLPVGPAAFRPIGCAGGRFECCPI